MTSLLTKIIVKHWKPWSLILTTNVDFTCEMLLNTKAQAFMSKFSAKKGLIWFTNISAEIQILILVCKYFWTFYCKWPNCEYAQHLNFKCKSFLSKKWNSLWGVQMSETTLAFSDMTYRDSNLRQMRREFRKLDLNRDGKISREEFVAMAEKCFKENNKC